MVQTLNALLPALAADSHNGSNPIAWLIAAGPVSAVATYWSIYRYYRNNDKSHAFERDTIIDAQPPTASEVKVDHIGRTRAKKISGDNSDKHRQRVQRVPSPIPTSDPTPPTPPAPAVESVSADAPAHPSPPPGDQ